MRAEVPRVNPRNTQDAHKPTLRTLPATLVQCMCYSIGLYLVLFFLSVNFSIYILKTYSTSQMYFNILLQNAKKCMRQGYCSLQFSLKGTQPKPAEAATIGT